MPITKISMIQVYRVAITRRQERLQPQLQPEIRTRKGIVPALCLGMQAVTLRVTERGSVPG